MKHFHMLMQKLAHPFKNDEGATAIEYGLIAALIAVVMIGAVTLVGLGVQGTFNTVAAAL